MPSRHERSRLTREHQPESNASVMSIRNNSIAPRHCAVQIPVVVTATAQPPFLTGTFVRGPIARNGIKRIRTNILTPFPDVAGHVVNPQLVWRLRCHLMSLRQRFAKTPEAPDDSPAA